MSGEQAMTVLTITAAIVFGMVLALLGSLKLALARRPETAVRPIDKLLTALNLALLPLMLLAGLLVDYWGPRPVLIFGPIVLALSFLALSAGPSYARSVISVLFAALGAACLGIATLVVMPRGLFGTHEAAASLQLGLVFVALGALLAPPLADLLISGIGFGKSMAVLALLCLMPAFLAALPDSTSLPTHGTASGLAVLGRLFQSAGMWSAAVVFFFYAPLEAFVGVWTVTYLANAGKARRQTAWLAGFWAMFMLSRLLFALVLYTTVLGERYEGLFLVLPALLGAVVLGNMSGTTRYGTALPGLLMLGFFMGPIFPILTGMLLRVHNELPGTAFALLHVGGSIGSLGLAPLVNYSVKADNIQLALRIPLFVGLLLTAASLVFIMVIAPR